VAFFIYYIYSLDLDTLPLLDFLIDTVDDYYEGIDEDNGDGID
jgi:hypothetical protein